MYLLQPSDSPVQGPQPLGCSGPGSGGSESGRQALAAKASRCLPPSFSLGAAGGRPGVDHSEAELPDRSGAAVSVSLGRPSRVAAERESRVGAPSASRTADCGAWLPRAPGDCPPPRQPAGERGGGWRPEPSGPAFEAGFVTQTSWTLPATAPRVASTASSMASCPVAPWRTASTSR